MTRTKIEEISGEQFVGEGGLWAAVLISLIQDLESPSRRSDHETARRIILQREGCFDLMSGALGIEPAELQQRILAVLKRRSRNYK